MAIGGHRISLVTGNIYSTCIYVHVYVQKGKLLYLALTVVATLPISGNIVYMQKILPHNRCCGHSQLNFGGEKAADPPFSSSYSLLLSLWNVWPLPFLLAGAKPMQAGHDGVDWCALVLNEVCILYIHASTDTLICSGLDVVGTCYVYMAVDGHRMYFLDIWKYSIA